MSKKKSKPVNQGSASAPTRSPGRKYARQGSAVSPGPSRSKPKDGGTRETVESVAIAFALAFLFKTFQAEAYVIPTGSMAPTLYGRHKELTCPSCRIDFQIGASTELEESTGYVGEGRRIQTTLCPNCRREIDALNAPVFNGDRIIVNKQVSEYHRFDVVVFKNPEEGHINYIKRLVGLPGETIRIRQGNLWMRRGENDRWQMLRKDDLQVQKDIQLLVYDDRYPPRDLLAAGWPERWAPVQRVETDSTDDAGWQESQNAWSADTDSRRYSADASDDAWHWLRYRHLIPTYEDWKRADNGQPVESPRASLVSDYCGFNIANTAGVHRGAGADSFMSDAYWVGDLTLNFSLNITRAGEQAAVRLELVEGSDRFGCEFDLANGTVEVTRINHRTDQAGEKPEVLATADTSLRGTGSWDVAFANVDNRLALWIDGDVVEFDQEILIDQNFLDALTTRPGPADTVPCGIAVKDAQVTASDLLVQRDLYYRNDAYQFSPDDSYAYYSGNPTDRSQEVSSPRGLHRKLWDPTAWAVTYGEEAMIAHERYGQYSEYRLADDEYLMFGDNSPRSKDSRLFDYYNRPRWGVDSHRYAVRERDLIGKALFVFWPHGVPFLNGGEGFTVTRHYEKQYDRVSNRLTVVPIDYPNYRFPFYPNLSRMKKIR